MASLELARSFLGRRVTVVIDRPTGSRHPQHGFSYPVNYGSLPGVTAPDGEDLDAYVLGLDQPLEQYTGVCIAVIHRLDDDDDKLVVVTDEFAPDDAQILTLTHFQEQFFTSEVIRLSITIDPKI